ncbi:mannose-6-phosphate isomerase [Affinibrenneria salicis]|uniref:Mannose-6-phosphate isomerase n=1 Tax=Affinibrenneria salicis TaxID=2590031 RepID=A0A5J5G1S8_9GAMM|nr:mannose-6-phosphate isomerase [Affinibrenneria salicis]KAA9000442.1 mannose-6-phosphate isomerase [Affinibrenneria salicis]
MHKLINTVQHYAWGSKTALTELYAMPNPGQLPMAELWMGAHPKSSSAIEQTDGQVCSLHDLIAQDNTVWLGEEVAARFGELPFLFKILCAGQPLSIQVHPDKRAAEAGFAKENAQGIPLTDAERNYKDANHKPELVYALTDFEAMNGFREFADIVRLLHPLADAHPAIVDFLVQPDARQLRQLFSALLAMRGDEKKRALGVLNGVLSDRQGEPWETIRRIAQIYPDDGGLFSPLLLNVVRLAPGEAMFLFARTPHAYLQGVALEVMANSDNVLRAGLTEKHIDIAELVANVAFTAKPAAQLLTQPIADGAASHFPVPVGDFAFSVYTLEGTNATLPAGSVAILLCLEGALTLQHGENRLPLVPGESVFVGANAAPVTVSGIGRLARAYAGGSQRRLPKS